MIFPHDDPPGVYSATQSFKGRPFPVQYLRQVFTSFFNALLVLKQRIVKCLFEISSLAHGHIKGRFDRAFFVITSYMNVIVYLVIEEEGLPKR